MQTITLNGNPTRSAFTLTFNGQTTGAIPVAADPPERYGLRTVPAVAGHRYSFAATWMNKGQYAPEFQVFETLDEVKTSHGHIEAGLAIGSTFASWNGCGGATLASDAQGYPTKIDRPSMLHVSVYGALWKAGTLGRVGRSTIGAPSCPNRMLLPRPG